MIGIDVGGANLKIVDESGVHIHYCPLWKESPLAEIIAEYKEAGADNAAVVMSGELADMVPGKAMCVETFSKYPPLGELGRMAAESWEEKHL